MGYARGKHQVLLYLSHDVYGKLRRRAEREGCAMSAVVERALARPTKKYPTVELSSVHERPLDPPEAALAFYDSPLLGKPPSDRRIPLEEAVALAVRDAVRLRPNTLRALVVVLAKHRKVDLDAVLRRLEPDDWSTFGAVVDLTARATGEKKYKAFSAHLARKVGCPKSEVRPFFTPKPLARYGMKLSAQDVGRSEPMRYWGFACATPLDDFVETVRRFAS